MSLLVMSSAYVSNEMRSEFGFIPPAFLPTGSGCLYELQFATRVPGEPRYITLPLGFQLPEIDAKRFEVLGVTPIFLPEDLSVTAALINAIETIRPDGPLRVLFGDTLIIMDKTQCQLPDAIAIKIEQSSHDWLYVDAETMTFSEYPAARDSNSSFVSCGYYSFSSPWTLVDIARTSSLGEVLGGYAREHKFTCFEPQTWLDFGHVSLFYQSKKSLLVSRAFNSVSVHDNVLSKSSANTRKIRAEANWYRTLPTELALHCPRFIGETSINGHAGYSLEYMYLPTLSDLFTLGRLPQRHWFRVFSSVADFLRKCQRQRPESSMPEAQALFADTFYEEVINVKSHKRLEDFITRRGIDKEQRFIVNGTEFPDLPTVLRLSLLEISPTQVSDISCWHGDLFFGNMLYDIRSERIICLDPRGLVGADYSIYGDIRYDLAKLSHSVYGKYDSIIGNRYFLRKEGSGQIEFLVDELPDQKSIDDLFEIMILDAFGMSQRQALAFCSILFLSMLPLHADDETRQNALLATALQCYNKWNCL